MSLVVGNQSTDSSSKLNSLESSVLSRKIHVGKSDNQNHCEQLTNKKEINSRDVIKLVSEWDNAAVSANMGQEICEEISKLASSKEHFLECAEKVLAARLTSANVKFPNQQFDDQRLRLKNLANKIFEGDLVKTSTRIRMIRMDAEINDIVQCCSQQNNGTPQIPKLIIREDGKVVLQKESVIENLALQGGGGKGFGYSPMIKTLQNSGQLDHLKRVAGSSVGALCAVAVAIGVDPDSMDGLSKEIQSAQGVSLDEVKKSEIYKPGHEIENMFRPAHNFIVIRIIEKISIGGISALVNFVIGIFVNQKLIQSAAGIVKTLDLESAKRISNFLENKDIESFKDLNDAEKTRLLHLKELKLTAREEGGMVTFNDLRIMNKIAPKNFKLLTVTGWNSSNRETLYFNVENTPDMPIAYAGRISMSFPVVFRPVQMDVSRFGGKYNDDKYRNKILPLRDGGIGSNSPIETFVDTCDTSEKGIPSTKTQLQQQKSLMCVFDNGGAAYRGESSKGGFRTRPSPLLTPIANMFAHANVAKNSEAEERRLNSLGQIMPVAHGELTTMSFNAGNAEIKEAQMMSEAWTKEWVRNYGNGVVNIELFSVDDMDGQNTEEIAAKMKEVAEQLSDLELAAILEKHGDGIQFPDEKNREFTLTVKFIEACSNEMSKRKLA
ncbi:MAG: patatin-like phospholipase family protein [Puniceicoccales bacterium]|jgi:predicted acylesterase/phospholipase RssA|nr:patatin-like phospholipase family protein [Puniceicoccales bacterium]